MHVYMVVKLLLLTMPNNVVRNDSVVDIRRAFITNCHVDLRPHVESVVSFSPFYSFLELSDVPVCFLEKNDIFSIQLSHGYSSG